MALSASAQTAYDDIAANPYLAGNQSAVYPEPTEALTPAPAGYTPFYMSHYGRHGSRFAWEYKPQVETLQRALQAGKLTALGEETLRKSILIRDEADKREGELTPLGATQHRGIAQRMYQNFPEIFASPDASIDARSTIIIRCILSMENALQQFSSLNPSLTITHDASEHDMYFMNHSDRSRDSIRKVNIEVYHEFVKSKVHPERLMRLLFNDDSYWHDSIDAGKLMRQLFGAAAHLQNTELRHSIEMISLFSTDELYDLWQIGNASWYYNHACCPLTEGRMPTSQSYLVQRIISDADSCLLLSHPSATLRYGHDGNVMPLTCLLRLDSLDLQCPLDELATRGWCDYKIIPMACNIQMIFYKPTADSSAPILIKILRNEREAHLPIATSSWPYYRWDDVRAYLVQLTPKAK